MTKPVIYSMEASPPCRTVLMAAFALGIDLEVRTVNMEKGDHLTEEYVKMNPQHTIPVLDDNGFILIDSHAIITYLADKYGKDDSLYPKDLQKRALIDQYFYFDVGYLFKTFKNLVKPILFFNQKSIPEDKLEELKQAYEMLNMYLEGKKWLVGDSYTLADIACATTISGANVFVNQDAYPNVKAWLQRCEAELPGYKEINLPGNKAIHDAILSIIN